MLQMADAGGTVRIRFVVFMFVIAWLLIGALAPTAMAVNRWPTGTFTNFSYPARSAGYTQMSWTIKVEKLSRANASTYWAHQWGWAGDSGGNAAYAGLQSGGYTATAGPTNVAIFSVWGSNHHFSPNCIYDGANFDGGSGEYGISCRLAYSWVVGQTYRLRVSHLYNDATGLAWWGGFVRDESTKVEKNIGVVGVRSTWKGIKTNSGYFTEYWPANATGGLANCQQQAYARTAFGIPVVSPGGYSGTITSARADGTDPECANGWVRGYGLVHETGAVGWTYDGYSRGCNVYGNLQLMTSNIIWAGVYGWVPQSQSTVYSVPTSARMRTIGIMNSGFAYVDYAGFRFTARRDQLCPA